MMRVWATFFIAALLGLITSAAFVHTAFPSAVAPDFMLILAVVMGFYYRTAAGAVGAFLLGLAADFASGQFLGPNAAGCVIAFLFVGLIAQRVYAERTLALMATTAICSGAKSLMMLLMFSLYLGDHLLPESLIRLVVLEALISAFVAPLVMKAMRGTGIGFAVRVHTGTALRWSSY